MIDDYAYLNARVRSLQGRLLSEPDFETALACVSLEELAAFLESTAYAPAVGEAMTLTKGIAGIEEGLRRDLQRTIDHVVSAAGGRPKQLLILVLGRWELFNIKTVLRGLHAHAGIESVMGSTLPFGRLDEVALKELARQPDVKAAIDLLVQWRIPYAPDLHRAYPVYRARGDLQVLELALDRAFFASGLRRSDPGRSDEAVVADCLRREIDLVLLSYALRTMHHSSTETAPEELFIPGGKTVTREIFLRLCAARTLAEFMDAVPLSPYTACLAARAPRYLELRRLSALDRALHVCFVHAMMRLVLGDPLSIPLAIGYLWRKVNEVTNLRLVARGKYAALPREEIEALMLRAG